MMMKFTRRKFMERFAAAGIFAGGVRPLFAEPAAEASQTCSLLIIGAGIAGLTAAALASENGVTNITVLESEPTIGGASIISGGLWAVSGTELQKRLNIQDSDELFENDIFTVGGHVNRPDVVKAYIRENRTQYNWMRTRLRIEPKDITAGAGVRRAHAFDARKLVVALYQYVKKAGVNVVTNTRAESLITDPSTGRVCGCLAVRGGSTVRYEGARHVILTTGGFARNRELLSFFSPAMRFVSAISPQGSRGDGIIMARTLGAALADMPYLEASYAFTKNPSTVNDMSLLPYYGAVIVNQESQRFTDESLPYKQIASAVLTQNSGRSWIVFDERIRKMALKETLDRHLWEPIDKGIVPEYVYRGRTLAEAAAAAGLDPVALAASLDAYNQRCKAGDPPRGPISSGSGKPVAVEVPPFYIMPAAVSLLGTYCGLAVNEDAAVLDKNERAIPGLLAAGEVTGGFHGKSFIMGTALSKAAVFGRIAGLVSAGVIK